MYTYIYIHTRLCRMIWSWILFYELIVYSFLGKSQPLTFSGGRAPLGESATIPKDLFVVVISGKQNISKHSYWKWFFIVDFPIEENGDVPWFSMIMLVYQRVCVADICGGKSYQLSIWRFFVESAGKAESSSMTGSTWYAGICI